MWECPEIGLQRLHRGKVREMFAVGADRLLLVATDRLSAFDVVFAQGIPGKGEVLTQMSALWFHATAGMVPGHLITTDIAGIGLTPADQAGLSGRSMVVRRARRIDVECVVRGYLAGSAWKEYRQKGTACGVPLPPGLPLNGRLPEPIFTPALKSDQGHDENVSLSVVAAHYGADVTDAVANLSLQLYAFASARYADAGILLADTKFEFGFVGDTLTVIDELFTPDSSRLWPVDRYRAGEPVDSLDKQPIRDYVQSIGWNLEPPAPSLPEEVLVRSGERYREALRRVRVALSGA